MFGGWSEPVTVNITTNVVNNNTSDTSGGNISNGTGSGFLNAYLGFINAVQITLNGILGNVYIKLLNFNNANHSFTIIPNYSSLFKYHTALNFLTTTTDNDITNNIIYDSRIVAHSRASTGDGTGSIQIDAKNLIYNGTLFYCNGVLKTTNIYGNNEPNANSSTLTLGTADHTGKGDSLILKGVTTKVYTPMLTIRPLENVNGASANVYGGLYIDTKYLTDTYANGTKIGFKDYGDLVIGPNVSNLGLHMNSAGDIDMLSSTATFTAPTIITNEIKLLGDSFEVKDKDELTLFKYDKILEADLHPTLSFSCPIAFTNASIKIPVASLPDDVTLKTLKVTSITNTSGVVSGQMTGALTVAGGVGISKDVYIGGKMNVGDGTDTVDIDTTIGAFLVNGGVGITKNTNIGGNLFVIGDISASKDISAYSNMYAPTVETMDSSTHVATTEYVQNVVANLIKTIRFSTNSTNTVNIPFNVPAGTYAVCVTLLAGGTSGYSTFIAAVGNNYATADPNNRGSMIYGKYSGYTDCIYTISGSGSSRVITYNYNTVLRNLNFELSYQRIGNYY